MKGNRMARTRNPLVFSSLGLLSLTPVLAACATAAEPVPADAEESAAVSSEEMTTEAPAETQAPAVPASYADGSYSAEGGYQSPNGPELVEVSLTLAGGVVTAVEVTPQATNSTSKRYQSEFAGGIAAETIGKPIDELDVSRIAGSSLTSGGFNEALASIKADATR